MAFTPALSLQAALPFLLLVLLCPTTTFAQDDKADRLQQLIDQKLAENKMAEVEVLRKWQAAQKEKEAQKSAVAKLNAEKNLAQSEDEELQSESKDGKQPAAPDTKPSMAEMKAKWLESQLPKSGMSQTEEEKLYFAFDNIMWRDVIEWIAQEGDLALHYEDLPTGSFSYSDPTGYDHSAAMDRLNLFLLPQGYTLVRSGALLSVINLADPRSLQTLDSLARLVKTDQLKDLPKHDVVKCMFPLGELEVEDAIEELSVLNLMTNPAPFNKTKQLLIIDTVAKLENVLAIIESFQPDTLDNGTVMKNFTLKHVEAEDILMVARPHLGLATGEMIGIDVSISADGEGKFIFVTGVEDKVKLIEGLVTDLDVPKKSITDADSDAELKTYFVRSGNTELIYNVLLTLLAGEDARVSMDREAGNIVAFATPVVQMQIKETVEQLEAVEPGFEMIPLKHADPYFVISLLDEMLDLPSALDDPEDIDPDAPRIDADPGNMRLFVHGKKHKIDEIRTIVEGLDVPTAAENDRMRVLPLKGEEAERVLETGAKFWRGKNPIILYPESKTDQATERSLHGESEPEVQPAPRIGGGRLTSLPFNDDESPISDDSPRTITANHNESEEPIRAQMTPRGLLLESNDADAVTQLEQDLRIIAGPLGATASPPIVYYLKYVKSEDALRLLAELLDGGENAREGEAGTLVNGFVSSSDSFLTSILSSRDGLMTMMAGSITVVSDSRLNRLITQGTAEDIARIEEYLRIIDKDKAIIDHETYGTSHVVELLYTNASEVADTVRTAFAGRIAGGSTGGAPQQGGAPGASGKEAAAAKARAAEGEPSKKGNSKQQKPAAPARNLEPTMTIAVHESSNSIIITAPEQLARQAKDLIETIDMQSRETVEVLPPSESAMLHYMLGDSPRPSSGSRSGNSQRAPSRASGADRLQSMLRQKFGGQ